MVDLQNLHFVMLQQHQQSIFMNCIVRIKLTMNRFIPKSVLIDLSGTVHVENKLISGTQKALDRLKAAGVRYRFVTNSTKTSSSTLLSRLRDFGLELSSNDVFSSLSAAHKYLVQNKLRPMLFLDEDAMHDFKDLDTSAANAVVIGLAPTMFHYEKLTEAFNCLQAGAQLMGMNKSRYFQRKEGLCLGPGAFVAALEYSADKEAKIIGKPSRTFFEQSIADMDGVTLQDCVMIGDDVRDDVGGAQAVGMKGILVQTGKYRPGDESKIDPGPYKTVESIVEAVDHIISLLPAAS